MNLSWFMIIDVVMSLCWFYNGSMWIVWWICVKFRMLLPCIYDDSMLILYSVYDDFIPSLRWFHDESIFNSSVFILTHAVAMPKFRLESKSDPSAATANTSLELGRTLRTSAIWSRYMSYFIYLCHRRYHLGCPWGSQNQLFEKRRQRFERGATRARTLRLSLSSDSKASQTPA